MNNLNDEDKLFEEIFGDLFNNPPTKEEIEARKKEEEQRRQMAIDSRRQFNEFAMTLPGAEKVRDDNPAVEIRGGINEDGESYIRTVTQEEKIEELLEEFSEIFSFGKSEDQNNGHYHR